MAATTRSGGIEGKGTKALTAQPAGPPLLAVEHLVKEFGGLRAIDRCSLQVRPGTITGLIGPNGAGKTTLFDLITGFYRPESGRIRFNGEAITGLPPHQVFDKGLCRTFQIPREFKEMTVMENLMLVPAGQSGERILPAWLRPRRVHAEELRCCEKATAVLKFVDLYRLRDEYAGTLSGGQKKLLELARTMMADPQMILLDEPGAGVNPTLMQRLVNYIERLCHDQGMTFLLIEHDMDLVMSLCDPIIVMSEGHVLVEGTPEEVRRDPRVLEAYLGGQYGAAGR